MRHSHILSSHFLPSNNNCLDSPVTDQTFNSKKCSYSTGSHSFTKCSWDNAGLTSNGGAIHYVLTSQTHQSLASLTVDKCTFFHCHETHDDGGAVHARYIGTATVSDSFFYDCECGTAPGQEGAGICFVYLSANPSIIRCTFISCVSADDGGGCSIWYSNSSVIYAIDSCRCIKCKGTKEMDSAGGGIVISHNSDFIACTNCLLYACEAKLEGGGIWTMRPTGETISPITFCYFRENKSKGARDIYFSQSDSTIQAIIHSFSSESSSGKVVGGSDNWLLQKHTNTTLTAAIK